MCPARWGRWPWYPGKGAGHVPAGFLLCGVGDSWPRGSPATGRRVWHAGQLLGFSSPRNPCVGKDLHAWGAQSLPPPPAPETGRNLMCSYGCPAGTAESTGVLRQGRDEAEQGAWPRAAERCSLALRAGRHARCWGPGAPRGPACSGQLGRARGLPQEEPLESWDSEVTSTLGRRGGSRQYWEHLHTREIPGRGCEHPPPFPTRHGRAFWTERVQGARPGVQKADAPGGQGRDLMTSGTFWQ